MSGLFTLLEVDSGACNSNDTKTRVQKGAIEIIRGPQLSPQWHDMYARYVISLSEFRLEQQLRFAAKLDTVHIHRL